MPRILIIKDPCNEPYLVRFTLAELLGREIKLHFMIRSDNDRELHDHPWSFYTLVLAGGYTERTEQGDFEREPGNLAFRPALWRHRVILRNLTPREKANWRCGLVNLMPWPVRILDFFDRFKWARRIPQWEDAIRAIKRQPLTGLRMSVTICFCSKPTRKWGFWRKGQFIPHDKFSSEIEC